MNERSQTLALYLIGLALIQKNGSRYVNHEIDGAIVELQKELNLNK